MLLINLLNIFGRNYSSRNWYVSKTYTPTMAARWLALKYDEISKDFVLKKVMNKKRDKSHALGLSKESFKNQICIDESTVPVNLKLNFITCFIYTAWNVCVKLAPWVLLIRFRLSVFILLSLDSNSKLYFFYHEICSYLSRCLRGVHSKCISETSITV